MRGRVASLFFLSIFFCFTAADGACESTFFSLPALTRYNMIIQEQLTGDVEIGLLLLLE